MEMKDDRISNLPELIVDKILSLLTLRDAVRTSILSSKWEYKWANLTTLVFDDHSVLPPSQDLIIRRTKLVKIVDRVLLLHNGPIHKFKLSLKDLQGASDIDQWILFLSRGSLKELTLEIWSERYKLPSSLYLCDKLSDLELHNCLLKPPSTFDGFKFLTRLHLQSIKMDQYAFENLIYRCPLLKSLKLINFQGFTHLKINAPKLTSFSTDGAFQDVYFENTFHLSTVSIANHMSAFGTTCKLIEFFDSLPNVQRLEVLSFFLKFLAVGTVPRRLCNPSLWLNYLTLDINFNDIKEHLAALCILRSSPNLLELEVLSETNNEQPAPRSDARSALEKGDQSCLFKQLRFIRIAKISGVPRELALIKFLLANSPVLQRMIVEPDLIDGDRKLLKKLLLFRRASALAQIVYQDK